MNWLCGRVAALVLSLFLLLAATAAYAGPYEDALGGLTADSFSDTGDAINALVASGDPRVAALLEALQDSRLLFSAGQKKVYVKDKSDKLTDAATGAPGVSAKVIHPTSSFPVPDIVV